MDQIKIVDGTLSLETIWIKTNRSEEELDIRWKTLKKYLDKSVLSYDYSNDEIIYINFPEDGLSLQSYIKRINKIIVYLDKINIKWTINDFLFKFTNKEGKGIVNIDTEANLVTAVYTDEGKTSLQKKIYQLGTSSKLL